MRRILIDGNHLTGRCRATLSEMTTSRNKRSGVIYGFLRGLHFLHTEHNIDYPEMTVCWDKGRSKKRMELYPEYKGNRVPAETTPEQELEFHEYVHQIGAIQEALEYVGCRQTQAQNVEADDLVGIFSRLYADQGDNVLIYSGDHDMHQLVDERIKILDPKKGVLGREEILAKWKLSRIDQIPILKAVMGDSSDNIAGVPKLGEVRAMYYITYADWPLDDIPSTQRQWVLLARTNQAIIDRNLALMKIPRSWDESFYTEEQALEAMERLLFSGQAKDMVKFVEFLNAWELNSITENLSRW